MKKTFIFLSLASVVMLSLFSACRLGCIKGKGDQNTQTYKPGDFTKIDIEGGYKVNLKQDSASACSVDLTADQNLFRYIKVINTGGKLRVYSRKSICPKGEMTLNISVRHLEQIKAAGGIEINGQGKFNVGDLHMDLTGATRITMDVNAANIETHGSGSTELNLSGQASSHKVEMNGSGKLHAFNLVVGKYNISTAGASDCEINVLNELNINSAGASDIKYKGNPATIHNDKAGAGSLQKVQ